MLQKAKNTKITQVFQEDNLKLIFLELPSGIIQKLTYLFVTCPQLLLVDLVSGKMIGQTLIFKDSNLYLSITL